MKASTEGHEHTEGGSGGGGGSLHDVFLDLV